MMLETFGSSAAVCTTLGFVTKTLETLAETETVLRGTLELLTVVFDILRPVIGVLGRLEPLIVQHETPVLVTL